MKRYESTPIKNRWDGKRVFYTTRYPTIVPKDTDTIIISKEGDYLDYLAYQYYGDPTKYWIIASANNLGKARMSVPPGLQLRIPSDINDILLQFNSLNANSNKE